MPQNIWTAGLMENITVAEVMDIRGDFVCAEYIDDDLSGADAAW